MNEHAETAISQSEVTTFNFGNLPMRTQTINNQPYFCLSDVCRVLDIVNVGNCKARLREDGIRTAAVIDSIGRRQQAIFINEPNLYKVIFQRRKPEAEKFTDWVTSEVLPSIRKFFKSKIVSENGKHLLDKTANSDYICRCSRNAMIDKKVSHAVINALPAQKHVKDGFFVFRRRIAEKFKTFFYVLWLLPEQVAYRWCCCNGAFSPVPVKGFFVTIKEER